MADDFTIDEGEGIPAGSGDDFDPSEMSLDEIDSLLSSEDDGSDYNFDSLPSETQDSGGFEDLLASSGDEYPDDLGSFEPEEFDSDLSQLDETVHLDEEFDFDLTDPLIDAEIDRLLDIEDDYTPETKPSSSSGSPSWKESSTPSSADDLGAGFGDLGGLDLGDFSQPGEIPPSAFHSEDKPFEWSNEPSEADSDSDDTMGFGDLEMEDETPISLSDDELHNIDISADLADFSMDEDEAEVPNSQGSSRIHEDDFLSDDEGPISLSEHELGDIMGEDFSPTIEEEGFGDLGGDDFVPPSTALTEDVNFEGEDEEKDIALSVDELDHLLSGEETSTSSEEDSDSFSELGNFGDLDLGETDETRSATSEFLTPGDIEEDANETIALSDDELGNLLSSGEEEEEKIEPIDLNSLDLGEGTNFQSDLEMEAPPEGTELDLSDFNFETEMESGLENEPTELSDDHEDSISLPISDFENFGTEDETSPLDTGMDLGDFDELPSSKEEDVLESIGDFTSARDEDILGPSAAQDDIFTTPPISSSTNEFLADLSDDEPIALSDDELGNLLSSGAEEEEAGEGLSDFGTDASDFMADADENEPIALSDDELGNLLASDEEETEPEFTSTFDDDENEPIALSDDELGNLLASDEEETEPEFTSTFDDDENEPIALSDDELGNLLASDEEETEPEFTSTFDDDENEPIALSDDELGDLLSSGAEEEPIEELTPSDKTPLEFGDFSLDSESDEPIALSEDELGNLLAGGEEETIGDFAEEIDEPISLPISELDDVTSGIDPEKFEVDWDGPVADLNELTTTEAAPSDWDLGEDADEPITLSNDELGNLLSDETPEEVDSEDLDALLSSPPSESDLDALGSMGGDIPIADLDFTGNIGEEIIPTVDRLLSEPDLNFILDEYADDDELSPQEEIRQTTGPADDMDLGEESNPTQDEMKRILLYLDELLGNLPDDMIRDFSRSDYFELYKKLMKQIGV